MKAYNIFLKCGIALMALTCLFHSSSLFMSPKPQNDTESQLVELMNTYKMDMGLGFQPSMANLVTALSSCFSLLCLLGALLLLILVKNDSSNVLTRPLLNAMLFCFAILFVLMLCFTFIAPVVCTGLIFISLLGARYYLPRA